MTALTLALVIHSFADAYKRDIKPNPFVAGPQAGIPTLAESPWHPMTHLDPDKLPWVLDPIEGWPDTLRTLLKQPCGGAAVLQRRYPIWLSENARNADLSKVCRTTSDAEANRSALVEAGFFLKHNPDGPMLAPTEDGWILERHRDGAFELVLSKNAGLLLRRTP